MRSATGQRLDLSREVCPAPLVLTRSALAGLTPGEVLRVTMAAESVATVPRALRDEGHEVLAVARKAEVFEVVLRAKGTRSGGDAGPRRACS